MESHIGTALDPASICEGLRKDWELTKVALKPFPACHFVHSSTWAAAELVAQHGLRIEEIDEIAVRIPAEGVPLVLLPQVAKQRPRTPYDAKFSLPFAVAHRLVHGHLDLSAFSQRSIEDRDVLSLASRVVAEPLPEPSPSRFAGGARVLTTDGSSFDKLIAHAPGSASNPLDEDWVRSKFVSNAELCVGPGIASELLDALCTLDAAPSLDRALGLTRAR